MDYFMKYCIYQFIYTSMIIYIYLDLILKRRISTM